MIKAYIEYCVDGYNTVTEEVCDLRDQLESIRKETSAVFSSPFAADIVTKENGIMSIALADDTVLCYKSSDLETQLTAVGDPVAGGSSTFWFGDLTLMSNKYLIPYSTALEATEFWLSTGSLSDKVIWTDELY